jgi:tetratricopeptide (TPR) repeat protein
MRARLCQWLALFVVLATAAPSLAKNKAGAREAFQRGIEHYNLSEFAPALDAFREAYRNYPDPSFLFNIGQCQRQLGQKRDAILSYKAYLRESAEAPNRDEVLSLISALESSIREEEQTRTRPPEGPLAPTDAGSTTHAPPTAPATPQATSLTARETAPPARTPVYKRWWLWTIVGVAAVGAGVGLGVGLTRGPSYPSATTSNGTFTF